MTEKKPNFLIAQAAQQTPQYTDVRQAGHDGGDFLFVRKK